MSQSSLSPYQATLFVRRSARDDVMAAARDLAFGEPVILRGAAQDGNVLRIRLTFAAGTATEAEQVVRRAFGCVEDVLAIADIELRPSFTERRQGYEAWETGGGSEGPPGGGRGSQR
jgi:hypothetical protein